MKRSTPRTHAAVFIAFALLVVGVGPAVAANNIILPRAGQVGFGVSGSYGSFLPSGGLGSEFGGGAGIAVRMRYRMRFERAFGLTFEGERMAARDPEGNANKETAFDSLQNNPPGVTRDRMKQVTAGFDFYQMFDTRERTVKYLSIGAGLAQISAHLSDGETQFPIAGDAVFISAGAGFERFFFKSWAWDLGTKYKAVFHDGKLNNDIQVNLGMMFYAAY